MVWIFLDRVRNRGRGNKRVEFCYYIFGGSEFYTFGSVNFGIAIFYIRRRMLKVKMFF